MISPSPRLFPAVSKELFLSSIAVTHEETMLVKAFIVSSFFLLTPSINSLAAVFPTLENLSYASVTALIKASTAFLPASFILAIMPLNASTKESTLVSPKLPNDLVNPELASPFISDIPFSICTILSIASDADDTLSESIVCISFTELTMLEAAVIASLVASPTSSKYELRLLPNVSKFSPNDVSLLESSGAVLVISAKSFAASTPAVTASGFITPRLVAKLEIPVPKAPNSSLNVETLFSPPNQDPIPP